MQNILDCVDLSSIVESVENENIFVSQFSSYSHIKGLYEFQNLDSGYKLLLFYFDSLSTQIIKKLHSFKNVIPCKYSETSDLYKFIPMIKSELNFNNAFICDIGVSRFYWKNLIRSFRKILDAQLNQNTYIMSLSGELINENLEHEQEFKLQTWHRISPDHIIINKGNEFPQNILNDRFNTDESVTNLTLSMMQHIQDNQIDFNYQILIFGNRVPFYYWLEHVKPSEAKKKEFLSKMESQYQTVEEFIGSFEYQKRRELYDLIRVKIRNMSFFEDERLSNCIRRIFIYFKNHENTLYNKRW